MAHDRHYYRHMPKSYPNRVWMANFAWTAGRRSCCAATERLRSAAGDTHDIVDHPIRLRTGNRSGMRRAACRAGRVGADGRHDGRRHSRHHRQSGSGVRGVPLRRLQPLRRAGAVGPVAQRQGLRHQAGPRHRVAGRSQRSSPLDLQAAPGREVARRLPVHRGRCAVELRPHHRREGAAVLHAADGAHARLHHQLRVGGEDRRQHGRDHHQGRGIAVPLPDELPADGKPLPGRGAALRLERLCRAPVRHRSVPRRPLRGA